MKKKIMSIILIVIMLGFNVQYVFAEDKDTTGQKSIAEQGKDWLSEGEKTNVNGGKTVPIFPGGIIGSLMSSIVSNKDEKTPMQTNKFSELAGMLLGIGVFVVLIVGVILGIRLMFTKPEDKAKAKQALIIYLIGSIIIFGATGIWKILVNLMDGSLS